MRYAYHRTSEEGELPRILFYSVLLHYVVFYIMFGNPFLIQDSPGNGASSFPFFDVQLLSPPPQAPPGGPKPEPVNRNISLGGSQANMTEEEIARLFVVPEGFRDGKAVPVVSRPLSRGDKPLGVGISVVDTIPALNRPSDDVQVMIPGKKVNDIPRNVDSPEDCLLKVVGMVCPNGDATCIAAYKEFCASLAN